MPRFPQINNIANLLGRPDAKAFGPKNNDHKISKGFNEVVKLQTMQNVIQMHNARNKKILSNLLSTDWLRRGIVGIIALLLSAFPSFGQLITQYTFSASSGTFTSISGSGTGLGLNSTDEGHSNNVSIGFTFRYCGTNYTTLSVSTNGWLVLGTTISNDLPTNNLGGTALPIIAPLWDDNAVSGSGTADIFYSVSGSAPNRVFTIEWYRMKWDHNLGPQTWLRSISFQVKLYETSNNIDFVYQQENNNVNNGSGGASIGIADGTTGSGHFLSLDGTGTSPNASSTTETSNLGVRPAQGQTYSFAYPTATVYYSQGSGDPNVLANWNTNAGGGGSTPVDFISDDQTFLIQNGHNMTTTASGWSVSGNNTTVEISNGGTLTADYQVTISASTTFQVDDGGTYVHNNTSSTVWNGTTSLGTTSAVTYQYSGAQNVAALNYGNLTIDGGNTKTIQGNATVNGTLTLSNGNLSLGSSNYNLTLADGATISGPFDNTHMIVCDGTGNLIKQSTTSAGFVTTYPVGTGTYYSPMQISSLSATIAGTGDVDVRAVSGTAPGPPALNSTDLQKYWVVSSNSLSAITADVNFTYNDPEEIGTGGNQTKYAPYLYSGGSWQIPTGASGDGVNPISTTGTNTLTGTWTAHEDNSKTYYSYQSGDWANASTWTTDPSGTLSENPGVPGVTDRVVILNGRKVYTTTGYTVVSTQINAGGTLDIQTSTGHDLGTVTGQGLMRLATSTFPSGTFTDFVSSTGGTVEYYNLNGTSISNTQLTYNNLIISNNTASNNSVFLDNSSNPINYTVNGNFTLKRSSTGSLTFQFGNATTSNNKINLTVYGNFTVNSGCSVRVNNFASAQTFDNVHNLTLYGNFVNNGSVRFTGLPSPFNNAYYLLGTTRYGGTNYGAVKVTFTGATDNTLTCNGTTDFYRLILDKGVDQTYTLEVTSTSTANFVLYGPNNQGGNQFNGGPEGFGTGAYDKALFINAGTLKLDDNINIPSLTEGGQDFNIIPRASLWLNGATVSTTVSGLNGTSYQAATLYGRLRITAGSFSTGDAAGIVLGDLGTPEIIVEETGTLDASQVWGATGGGNKISFIQSGGTVNLRMQGENHGGPMLGLSNANTVIDISGGTLNFTNNTFIGGGTDYQLMDIQAQTGNYSITGGTLNLNLPSSGTAYTANSTVPFYNVNVSRKTGGGTVTITWGSPSTSLNVLNDLTLNANTNLNLQTNTIDLNVGHDFTMDAASTYNCGNNTTTFNGSSGQQFINAGTITAGLNNLVISNGSNTDISSANLTIRANLTINSGCYLNDVSHSINVAGNIVNSGTHTSQANGGIILNGTTNQTIGGSGNGIFGNLAVNKTGGTASLIANQNITGNLRLANGLLDVNTYNLVLGSGSNVYDALTGTTAVFSGTRMIRTSGNASDGGVTKTFNSTGTFIFPIGTASDFTPATIQISSAPSSCAISAICDFNKFLELLLESHQFRIYRDPGRFDFSYLSVCECRPGRPGNGSELYSRSL